MGGGAHHEVKAPETTAKKSGEDVAYIFAGLIAYFVGCTPVGLIVAWLAKGIDIRDVGSGNIGATNVGRHLGFRWFLVVFVLDGLKGLLPTLLLPMAFGSEGGENQFHMSTLCGAATIVGHMFSVWLKFKGGKGVATTVGVILVIGPTAIPWAFFVAFVIFMTCFFTTRIVSLCSMLAATGFGVTQAVLLWPIFTAENWSLSLFSLGIPALIIVQHRSNIARLLKGEEHQFRKKKNETEVNNSDNATEATDSETATS